MLQLLSPSHQPQTPRSPRRNDHRKVPKVSNDLPASRRSTRTGDMQAHRGCVHTALSAQWCTFPLVSACDSLRLLAHISCSQVQGFKVCSFHAQTLGCLLHGSQNMFHVATKGSSGPSKNGMACRAYMTYTQPPSDSWNARRETLYQWTNRPAPRTTVQPAGPGNEDPYR